MPIRFIIKKRKEKIDARNEKCKSLIEDANKLLEHYNNLFNDDEISSESEKEWINNYDEFDSSLSNMVMRKLKKASCYKELLKLRDKLISNRNNFSNKVFSHNKRIEEIKINNARILIGKIECYNLDDQQMASVIKDSHNQLVIAGAGTGKTTTIIGKIKYLLKSNLCNPQDILVLSFTNASAAEMRERILKETNENITAITFHKLGLNILKESKNKVPKISTLNLQKFIKEQIKENMKDPSYLNLLNKMFLYNFDISKSEFSFKSKAEYDEYLRLNPPTTLRGETVKSYGELYIANFLTQNQIKYIYECPYKFDTNTEKYGQYNPDFYLPEFDVYIEYFGIDRQGNVPKYFTGRDGLTASQAYNASIEWKRNIHKQNGTSMIECYSYEMFEDNLLETLSKKLTSNGIVLNPLSEEELWKIISEKSSNKLDGFFELVETLINLIKSNDYTIQYVRDLVKRSNKKFYNLLLLDIFEPIFTAYCNVLKETNSIDFNDMINDARRCVDSKTYISPYKYVIVDEYQDISKARYNLLKSLRNSNDYKLFCVGDDWQSIYRFAGSDIGLTLNFQKYWGETEFSKIETTYRFSQRMIDISGSFIMNNPNQIKKEIISKKSSSLFALGEVNGYKEHNAIDFMLEKLNDLPQNSSVFFIGRYIFDGKLLKDNNQLTCRYNKEKDIITVTYQKRPDLKMRYLTAHRSKGLQADYVFIINNKRNKMGFPSKIQDCEIITLLLDNTDDFPYAEERRLFYVALTRSKKKTFLITEKGNESEFVLELKSKFGEEIKREAFSCPRCGGNLILIHGQYGDFYGCSNYRTNGCTYKRQKH